MALFFVLSFLLGAALATRWKALALLPGTLGLWLGLLLVQPEFASGIWWTVAAMALSAIGLQFGYLAVVCFLLYATWPEKVARRRRLGVPADPTNVRF